MEKDIVQRITELERWQEGLELPEIGSQPVWLREPYTNTTFDGDSFSDVGAHTKIENTSWSTTIPTNAKALLIQIVCRDSGSAGTASLYFLVYPAAGATTQALGCWPSAKANDDFAQACGIVPCTDGDIWYQVNASGATTMDVWLYCFGYWL